MPQDNPSPSAEKTTANLPVEELSSNQPVTDTTVSDATVSDTSEEGQSKTEQQAMDSSSTPPQELVETAN